MASILVQTLVDSVRNDSDLNESQIYADTDIATLLSDAGADLYDLFSGANQLYNVSTFDFTLVGGVGQNTTPLPADFQQGHGVDVNPNTAQPYTLRFLSNWGDRNKLTTGPFFNAFPGGGPREYTFLDDELMVLPAMSAAGLFRLYYTPIWTPLMIPASVDVETASISVPVDGLTTGIGSGGTTLIAPSGFVFLSTDVGCSVAILGATNSDNNGTFTITSFISTTQVGISGSHTSETFPITATVTLLRQSSVTAGGTWTLFGDNAFDNTTIDVNVGDTLIVSGASNPANNGSFTITAAADGGNTIVTAGAAGLVAQNFATAPTITVQPGGTTATLMTQMNSWIIYLKTLACITIRNKRGQDVDAFERRLQVQKDRIEKILQDRPKEPTQPPLTRTGDDGWWGI